MIDSNIFTEVKEFNTIRKICDISTEFGYEKYLENLQLTLDKTDSIIIESLSKLRIAMRNFSYRILNEEGCNLPMVEPRGLKIKLYPLDPANVDDLKDIYASYKRSDIYSNSNKVDKTAQDPDDPVQGYSVNKYLYPTEREPITDEPKLKAILGSKGIPNSNKVAIEVTKKMVQEAVTLLSLEEQNTMFDSIMNTVEELRAKHISDVCKLNHLLEESKMEDTNNIINSVLRHYDNRLLDYYYENTILETVEKNFKNAVSIIGAACYYDPTQITSTYELATMKSEYWLNEAELLIESFNNSSLDILTVSEGVGEKLLKARSKIAGSDNKFLEKYAKKALASNCIGVVIDKWYVPREDLEEKYEKAKNDFNKTYRTNYKTFKELENAYNKYKRNIVEDLTNGTISLGKRSKENEIKKKFTDDKFFIRMKTLAVTTEKNHKVTKSDVSWAVKFLKSAEIEIANLRDRMNKKQVDYVVNDGSSFIGDIKALTSEQKTMVNNFNKIRNSGLNEIEINYLSAKISQMKILRSQARLIIMKAIRAKDKDAVKELAELDNTDYNIFDEMAESIFEYFIGLESLPK